MRIISNKRLASPHITGVIRKYRSRGLSQRDILQKYWL
jgi:hypothetical protein